jgi:hypothetical protein
VFETILKYESEVYGMFGYISFMLISIVIFVMFVFNIPFVFSKLEYKDLGDLNMLNPKGLEFSLRMDLIYLYFLTATMFYLDGSALSFIPGLLIVFNVIVSPIKFLALTYNDYRNRFWTKKIVERIMLVIEMLYVFSFMVYVTLQFFKVL